MFKKQQATLWIITAFTLIGLLSLSGLFAPVTQAGAGLPNRDTPTPTPVSREKEKDSGPVGAYIELQVQNAPAGVWTVVQWQNSEGGWHDVEGWQGTLDANGGRRWWVDAKDFNTGPFRWQVMSGPHGTVLGSSSPFYLPGRASETVQVGVSLAR